MDKSLDDVSTFDNFSVTFEMFNEDWSKPFGSQIVGNYTNRAVSYTHLTLPTKA